MDQFWLTFRHEATERQYATWITQSVLRRGDSDFLWVISGVGLMALFGNAGGSKCWFPLSAIAFGVGCIVWEIRARKKMGLEELAARRTFMVLRTRTLLQFISCAIRMKDRGFSVTNLAGVCVDNGSVLSTMLALCLRLDFRHHLPYQILATFATLFLSIKSPCLELTKVYGGSYAPLLANGLDCFAKGIMDLMYGRFGLHASNQPLMCPCIHVMVWLHVYVILLLGCYVLWRLERCSRIDFIQTLSRERRRQEGLTVGFEFTLYMEVMHAALLVVAFGVIWELNFFVVKAIHAFGL